MLPRRSIRIFWNRINSKFRIPKNAIFCQRLSTAKVIIERTNPHSISHNVPNGTTGADGADGANLDGESVKSRHFKTLEIRVQEASPAKRDQFLLLLSDITVAWDISLISSQNECLKLLEDMIMTCTNTSFNEVDGSLLHSLYSSYLHVAAFYYEWEASSKSSIENTRNLEAPKTNVKIKSLLHLQPSVFLQLLESGNSTSPSRALDRLISFLLLCNNREKTINILFNLLSSPSASKTNGPVLAMLVDKYAALPDGKEVRHLSIWTLLLHRLVLNQDRVPVSTWISFLYNAIVIDRHAGSKFNSDWKTAVLRDANGQVDLLDRTIGAGFRDMYSMLDVLVVLLMHYRENEKIVNTCTYSMISPDSLSTLVFGSVIQRFFKLNENKKAIYLLHYCLSDMDLDKKFPRHLIDHIPPPPKDERGFTKKKFTLRGHQKLYERVVIGLALGNMNSQAIHLFEKSEEFGVKRTQFLYNGLITALLKRGHKPMVTHLVNELKEAGMEMHPYTMHAYISHLFEEGDEEKARVYLQAGLDDPMTRELLAPLQARTTCTDLQGVLKTKDLHAARTLFLQKEGHDAYSFSLMIKAEIQAGNIEFAELYARQAIETGRASAVIYSLIATAMIENGKGLEWACRMTNLDLTGTGWQGDGKGMFDNVGLELVLQSLCKMGMYDTLYSMLSRHAHFFFSRIRQLAILDCVRRLLEKGYFEVLCWCVYLDYFCCKELLETAFRLHLAQYPVPLGSRDWNLECLHTINSLCERSDSADFMYIILSTRSSSPSTTLILRILLLEVVRREKGLQKFQVGDTGIRTLFNRIPVLPLVKVRHRSLSWELVETGVYKGMLHGKMDKAEENCVLVGDMMKVSFAPFQNSVKPEVVQTLEAEDAISRRTQDTIRNLCRKGMFEQAANRMKRVLSGPPYQREFPETMNVNSVLEYLDMIVYYKLNVPGFETATPAPFLKYLLRTNLKARVPPEFIGRWYANAMKHHSDQLPNLIFEECIKQLTVDKTKVCREIFIQLAASNQTIAAVDFYKNQMQKHGIELNYACRVEMVSSGIHQNNFPLVIEWLGPIFGFDFEKGVPVTTPHTIDTHKDWGGALNRLVWRIISQTPKMRGVPYHTKSSFLYSVYFHAARSGVQPKGRNLMFLVDYLIKMGRTWSIALVPYLEKTVKIPRYSMIISIMQERLKGKKFSDSLLNGFQEEVDKIVNEMDCKQPRQLQLMWAFAELIKPLRVSSGDYEDLATIVLSEFVRLQLPGTGSATGLALPLNLERLVQSYFRQCTTSLVRWRNFPASPLAHPNGLGEAVVCTHIDSTRLHTRSSRPTTKLSSGSAIKLTAPLPEITGPIPTPATLSTVVDSTLPLVGSALWLYKRIRSSALPSSTENNSTSFRQRYTDTIAKEMKKDPKDPPRDG